CRKINQNLLNPSINSVAIRLDYVACSLLEPSTDFLALYRGLKVRFAPYDTAKFYDEMLLADGRARPGTCLLKEKIESLPDGELLQHQEAAERLLLQSGITFNVYGDSAATEKIFPFDIIPRIVEAREWEFIEKGLKQRVFALNLF